MGKGSVGKSCLTVKFVQDRYSNEYYPTIEDCYEKLITIDGDRIKLTILDTAGQDDFSSMREVYMRQGQGFVLVCAFDDPESLDELEELRKSIAIVNPDPNVPIIVAANKSDLTERKVSETDIANMCKDLEVPFFATSAQKGTNVVELFESLTRIIRKNKHVTSNDNENAPVLHENLESYPGGCICNIC